MAEKGSLPSAQGDSFTPFSCFPSGRGKSPSRCPAAHPSSPNVASSAPLPHTLQGMGSSCSRLLQQGLLCGYLPPFPQKVPVCNELLLYPTLTPAHASYAGARYQGALSKQLKSILVILCPRRNGPTPASVEMLCQEPGGESCRIPFVHCKTTKRMLPETARRDERLTQGQEPPPEIQGRKAHGGLLKKPLLAQEIPVLWLSVLGEDTREGSFLLRPPLAPSISQ